MFEFLDRGYYDTHLRRLHDALDARYHACLEALRDTMPDGVRWSTPGGGPTLWLELPRSVELPRLRDRLATRGVVVEDAGGHFHGAPHLHGFRVGYAFLREEVLRTALERVAETLAELGVKNERRERAAHEARPATASGPDGRPAASLTAHPADAR